MKEHSIKDFHINKKVFLFSVFLAILAIVVNLHSSGIKDLAMLFVAVIFLVNEIYLIFIDTKRSIYLFLISLPFLVTARKFMQIDLGVIKVSFESIYITILFIYNFKKVLKTIRNEFLKEKKSISSFYLLILIFLVFVYNSNSYSQNIFKSLSDTYLGVVTPIMFMLVIISTIKKMDEKYIIYSIILSTNLSCLYGFFQIFKDGIILENISKNRLALTFGYHNVNIFAGILITVFPFVLEYILYKRKELTKKERIYIYISLGIQLFALGISFTRGAWLTAVIAIFLIFLSKKYKKVVICMIIIGAIFLKPAMSFILTRGNSVGGFLQNESAVARIQSISTDVMIIKKYPFGIGMSSFPEYYKEFALRGYLAMPQGLRWSVNAAHYMLEHAHNLILQIGVEFGLISLMAYILMIINRIKITFKNYEKNRGYFVSMICYLIFSTLTGNEFNHKGVITGTILIFLVMALIQISNRNEEDVDGEKK